MLIHPKSKAGPWIWLIGLLCLCMLAGLRWPEKEWLAVDFQALLPAADTSPWITIANQKSAAAYDSRVAWLIEGQDPQQVSQFANTLIQQLEQAGYADPEFQQDQLSRWRSLTEILLSYHRGLLLPEDYQLVQQNPGAYFEQQRRLLYSPLGGAALTLLAGDPSGLFANYLARLTPEGSTANRGPTGSFSELLVTSLPAETLGFTNLPQFYQFHQALQDQAQQQQLTLSASGAPLFAAFGVQSAQREVSTIGLASLALLMALLLLFLRSAAAVALTFACIFTGIASGLLVTVAVFQQIHVLTLVFGASLIGIAADYALHYLSHSRSADWEPSLGLSKVYSALRLSVLSSVVAFGTLLLLPFPGIRQIGLFMASGLVCSFVTVCLLFPSLYRGIRKPAPLAGIWIRPRWSWRYSSITLAGCIVLAIAALARLPVNDDVRAFYAAPEALATAQDRVAAALPDVPDSRYFLLEAPDQRQLLELEERLSFDLVELQQSLAVGNFSGIGVLIPSIDTQLRSAALLASDAYTEQLGAHMKLVGLSDERQRSILAALEEPYDPLDIDTLSAQPLPVGINGFLGCDSVGCASQITLAGVNNIAALESLADAYPQVQLIDQIGDINRGMGLYRVAVSALLVVAALLIGVLLTLFYGWRMAASILAVPLATCLFSLSLMGYWQGGISLINILALLLLIGVSLDYAIFRALSKSQEQAATTLAISLSAATSILAFGMLGFSDTPVISSFGQTIALGLVFAWLFSWLRLGTVEQ